MDELLDFTEMTSCIDAPRESDYMFWDVFWEIRTVTYSPKVYFKNTPILDQWWTLACTCFALAKSCNEENFYDTKISWAWEKLREEALARWASTSWWWYLQSAMDMGRELKIIAWYVRTPNINSIKAALSNRQIIYTWTNKCNWKQTVINKRFTYTASGSGHAFCIVWYDDAEWAFIAANSWGESFWYGWYFYINYWDLENLFSCYALVDKQDKPLIDNYKKMKDEEAKLKAIQAWIISDTRMDEPATRYELALMFGRLLEKLWK